MHRFIATDKAPFDFLANVFMDRGVRGSFGVCGIEDTSFEGTAKLGIVLVLLKTLACVSSVEIRFETACRKPRR